MISTYWRSCMLLLNIVLFKCSKAKLNKVQVSTSPCWTRLLIVIVRDRFSNGPNFALYPELLHIIVKCFPIYAVMSRLKFNNDMVCINTILLCLFQCVDIWSIVLFCSEVLGESIYENILDIIGISLYNWYLQAN